MPAQDVFVEALRSQKSGSQARDIYNFYLDSPAWKSKRLAALNLAGHRCQLCNGTKNLHVHHRTYERIGDEELGDLTVLCKNCHYRFHEKPVKAKKKNPRKAPRKRRVVDLEDGPALDFYSFLAYLDEPLPRHEIDLSGLSEKELQQAISTLRREKIIQRCRVTKNGKWTATNKGTHWRVRP